MRRFSTVVTGVVFPGGESYLKDYAASLAAQDDQEFDLLLVNDGADPEFRQLFPENATWINVTDKKSPSEIRQFLITEALSCGYEHLVFSDVDDYFSSNRVSRSKRFLKDYDFVFNELVLVDTSGAVLQDAYLSSLGIPPEVNDYEAIEDKNFIGLGNSAINLSKAGVIFIPKSIVAIDWWIFSLLLIDGARGKFIPDSFTYYRQHERNFIGMRRKLTKESLLLGIRVKVSHFSALLEYAQQKAMLPLVENSRRKRDEIEQLSNKVNENDFCEQYIDRVNNNAELFTGWWSEIVPASHFDSTAHSR